ncbi:MAG TPA: hypothetical protein DCM87_03700 [Planctomycetes bacterium]|nr:hypothetical protein [Planctomycetota bacterium]
MDNFWEHEGWEQADPHLSKVRAMPFQRRFPFVPEKPGLYIVRGPRQIGKSSWLKTILSYHASRVPCFYLSCENIPDHLDLAEILKSVRDRKVVLLDEVNFVKDWDRAVKHEVDSGKTSMLVLTGSHAYDLTRGADRMPGRFGSGGEFELLPMGFDEFLAMREQAGWRGGERVEALRTYFRVGGFPTAVAEAGAGARRPRKAMATYLRWLTGDAAALGKQETYLKELLIQLAQTLQTPISLQTLAKKTRIGSHNTVQDYVALLEACFAVRTLYAVDLDSGAYRFKKEKKFYFTDPLLFWIALDLSGMAAPDNVEDRLAEMVAHEALSRRFGRFGYLRTKAGEIDFVCPKRWAVEVKWSAVPRDLSPAYKRLPLLDKTVWTHANFLTEFPHASPDRDLE